MWFKGIDARDPRAGADRYHWRRAVNLPLRSSNITGGAAGDWGVYGLCFVGFSRDTLRLDLAARPRTRGHHDRLHLSFGPPGLPTNPLPGAYEYLCKRGQTS